jgi:cyclophilin family peptidyl-prolyl cis-trans isomerase
MGSFRCIALLGFFAFGPIGASRGAGAASTDGLFAEFDTPRGTIICELFFEKARLTVTNFVGLAEGSLGPAPRKPFYDGLTFHRVAAGFVVQGGDPLGTGEGGPGYVFPDEFVPGLRHDSVGILAMANSGPDTNGSQFFFTLGPVNRLNYLHSVFGHVITGTEILPLIKAGDTMTVKIIRRGTAAENFRADETSFAKLVAAMPRAAPPAFDDPAGLLQSEPPRAKALDTKLKNFTRFSGVLLYARLYEKFEPAFPGQTPDQFIESAGASLPLSPNGVLAAWFAAENKWYLVAPGRSALKLPPISPWPALSPAAAASPEALILDKRRRLLAAFNEVIDGLIFQLEASSTPVGGNDRISTPANH